MIDHVTIRVSNLQRSKAFYDRALTPLGLSCLSEGDGYCGYGVDRPEFWITQEPDSETRVHVAFRASTQEMVHAFHEAARAAGGTDHGGPGPRPEYHERYYGAFVLDPDGNNIEGVFGNS